jgi:SNF2 family DNA or RNA helicase
MTELKLHDYQIVGRDYLRERGRAGLFMDMGLGKTATCLAALEDRHLPAMVVAPKRVAEEVWDVEAELWRPDLSVSIAMGEPKARERHLRAGADVTVIGRDNARDLLELPSRPWRTVILDELSGYKTRSSVRWKTMRQVVGNNVPVWGLTGTPSPNGLVDLWAQIYLLDGGQRLGKSITGFRDRYFYPGYVMPTGVVTEWIPKPETPENLERLIEDICLSMKADGRIELPELTWNHLKVHLPDPVMKAYHRLKNNLLVDLTEIFGGEIHTAANAATVSSRLSQMAAGFIYVDEAELNDYRHTKLHTKKIEALQEIVEGTGSPVLVFYRFNAERDMIMKAIPHARSVTEPGVIKEWNRGEVPVMIAHPASASHGLNLQHGGHTIVWTSITWDLELWEQANKRLHRQGQKHPVIIHVLMADGTVDSAVLDALENKQRVQDRLMEHLESPV